MNKEFQIEALLELLQAKEAEMHALHLLWLAFPERRADYSTQRTYAHAVALGCKNELRQIQNTLGRDA